VKAPCRTIHNPPAAAVAHRCARRLRPRPTVGSWLACSASSARRSATDRVLAPIASGYVLQPREPVSDDSLTLVRCSSTSAALPVRRRRLESAGDRRGSCSTGWRAARSSCGSTRSTAASTLCRPRATARGVRHPSEAPVRRGRSRQLRQERAKS
jgi:hypothetical protein